MLTDFTIKKFAIIVALLFVSPAANAQSEGCIVVGEEIFCPPEQGPFAALDNAALWRRVEHAREELRRRKAAQHQVEVIALTRRQQIGKLIASGDCKSALDTALVAGDLALAKEVKSLCP